VESRGHDHGSGGPARISWTVDGEQSVGPYSRAGGTGAGDQL
jgi:hypothetical protein